MKLNKIILPIAMLVASTRIYSMDAVLEEAGRAAGRGVNIARAEIPVDTMNNNHVYGEHQTIYNMGGGQTYDERKPFFRQVGTSFLSGILNSTFSFGNLGDKAVDYGIKIGMSALINLALNSAYKLWSSSPEKKIEQESQKRLANLAAHNELLQSIAAQLSRMPRLTEEDKASYATVQQQYTTMFKAFAQDAHDYMQRNRKAEKAF